LDEFRERQPSRQVREEELSNECETLREKLEKAEETAELKRYRAVEKERTKWESREERLLQQLKEAQERVQTAEARARRGLWDESSYSGSVCEGQDSGAVKPLQRNVSDYHPLMSAGGPASVQLVTVLSFTIGLFHVSREIRASALRIRAGVQPVVCSS